MWKREGERDFDGGKIEHQGDKRERERERERENNAIEGEMRV